MSATHSLSLEDKEKGLVEEATNGVNVQESSPEAVIINRYGRFGPILERLFASGVEARGVERVPEDQRENKNSWNKCVQSIRQFSRVLITPAKPLDVVVSFFIQS